MAQPLISVIVPVYNTEKYLERCIASLRNQTLGDIEIILVDDSSTDSSLEICYKLANEDDRIKVLSKVNEGCGMARNAGLAIASGEYIGFVDSDDFVEPEMFKTQYEKAKRYDADLVLSGVVFVDGNIFSKASECIRISYFDNDTQFDTAAHLRNLRLGIIGAAPGDADDSKYGMGVAKNLFRLEIIRKYSISFASEREIFSEDALFMIDYISCIQKATGIPEAFYNYCRNGDSISKSYKKDRFEKCLVFVNEVEKRFRKDIDESEYRIYIHRFWQAMCRVICSQEIMHAVEHKIAYAGLKNRLKTICTHPLTVLALREYPIDTLPIKQRIFAYAMKYRLYYMLKVLVILRSK